MYSAVLHIIFLADLPTVFTPNIYEWDIYCRYFLGSFYTLMQRGILNSIYLQEKYIFIYVLLLKHGISQFRVTPDDGLISRYINIYRVVLLFQFCYTNLEVPLISMNMYHLELVVSARRILNSFIPIIYTKPHLHLFIIKHTPKNSVFLSFM